MLCTTMKYKSHNIQSSYEKHKNSVFFHRHFYLSILTNCDISASSHRSSSRSSYSIMAEIMWLQHALDLLFRKIQKMSLNVFPHAARRPPECQKSFLSEAITKKLTSCTLKNTKYRKLLLNIVVGV